METVVIGKRKLTIEDVVAVAKRQALVELDDSLEFQKMIDSGAEFWTKRWLNMVEFMA